MKPPNPSYDIRVISHGLFAFRRARALQPDGKTTEDVARGANPEGEIGKAVST
jgi:hypothetical protein